MGTLIEEIFSRRAGRTVQAGEIVLLDVDTIMSHDNTTPLAIKAFREIGKPLRDPSRIVIHFDHAYPAPNLLAAENQQKIVRFIREQGIPNFYHRGVCHQVMIEEGFVRPGGIVIGADSHTVTYGALGCFSTGLGSSEIGAAWVTGKTWFKTPPTIHVVLEGRAQPGVFSKDVMLHLAGQLGMDGATYRSLEFSGPYIDSLPVHERLVFSNMSVEVGAKCGLIAADDTTIAYLEQETRAVGPFERIAVHNPQYEREIHLDVSQLGPQVACHPDVDQVRSLESVQGLALDQVYIGTCTNGRYEDLVVAANILRGRQVHRFTRTLITPASQTIYEKALANGLIQVFLDAGCTVNAPGCGACIGRHGGVLAAGERALTTMNRNFIGRMGSPEAEIFLGSPAAAAASALEGCIADPRKYL
ncbi:MAG: 3-isopropylmalate dehydratase large subunit [Anaerolineae bacterium]|nr:3-isopropylmalate dehydratase large subunit [Anaerolineae bacterium]